MAVSLGFFRHQYCTVFAEPPGGPGDHVGQVSAPADFSESETLSTLTSLWLLLIQNKEAEWEASSPWEGSYKLGLTMSKLSKE